MKELSIRPEEFFDQALLGDVSPVSLDDAYGMLSTFLIEEARGMDPDEPFVDHYIIGFLDESETVLGCDIELSTPGIATRTYYGASAVRLGADEFAVDLEGSSRFLSVARRRLN